MADVKPWEETWFWDDARCEIVRKYPDDEEHRRVGLAGAFDSTDPVVETDSGIYGPREGYRELIAAAPEMARLLLELQWAGGYGDDGGTNPCCPACNADAPLKVHFPAKRIDAYTRTEARDEVIGGKHRDDCRLVAVLRKAGVIE